MGIRQVGWLHEKKVGEVDVGAPLLAVEEQLG